MPGVDDARLDQVKFLALYARLAGVQLGTLVNAHDYHAVRRLVRVEGEGVAADGDDPLAALLVDGIHALPSVERDGASELALDPAGSLAALFQEHPLARALKPKLWVGYDLRGDAPRVCGMLTSCAFERDDALGTTRLTHAYCAQHGVGRGARGVKSRVPRRAARRDARCAPRGGGRAAAELGGC